MTKLCFRQINLICETDLSEAERPFGRLLLQSQQEEISTWIRAAAMGTEEGTDVRGNRKTELTTNRLLGSRGGREREAKTTGRFWAWVIGRAVKLLTKIGYTGGGVERKMLSSVLHTLKCGGAFFFLPVTSVNFLSGNYMRRVNGLPGREPASPHCYGLGQDPSHFLNADFTDKLYLCFT